jgi:TolB protein
MARPTDAGDLAREHFDARRAAMSKRATLALLLTVGVATPAGAQDVECDSSKVLKSVIAVSGNRHAVNDDGDLIGTPPVNTLDIYLLDPDELDANGKFAVWRHLPGQDSDSAPALSPDGKGRIVFDSNRLRGDGPLNTAHLFLMKADGSHQRPLTKGSSATWAPDGKRIAFHASASGIGQPVKTDPGAPTSDSVLFVAKVGDLLEGALPQQITHPIGDDPRTPDVDEAEIDDDSDWSPVGDRIVFTRKKRDEPDQTNPVSAEIYVVKADGTGLTRLTNNAEEERSPAWSPDGNRIAYSCRTGTQGGNTLEICVMTLNADGTVAGVDKVTDNIVADLSPHWTPDGRLLVQRPEEKPRQFQGQQVWVMEADGTVQEGTQRTTRPGAHMFPSWGEIKVKCAEKQDEDD